MKIGHPAEKPGLATPATAAPANGTTPPTGSPAAVASSAIPAKADPSANIRLSSTASTLLSGGSSAEFDAEKVARISKSIEDGTFKVNHGAIADKLISNAQEVLSKVQS